MTRPTLRGTLLPVPSDEEARVPIPARGVLAVLGTLRPGRSLATRLENLYIAVLLIAVVIGLFWTFSKKLGTVFVDVANFYHFIWGPALVVLLFLGALRYSTVQGFVSFTEPDCLYLLQAPIRRRDLVRSKLLSSSVLLGIVGAIVGILVVVASSGAHTGARIGQGALAGLALGILLISASWHVQRLRWATALVMRLTLPMLGLAILLAFLQTGGPTARLIALWSGPWGWGILPLASDAPSYGLAGLGALCVLALAAAISLYRTAGGWTLEGFRVRARTRSAVVASLYAFDYRSIGQAAKADKPHSWQGILRPRVPSRPALIIPWHGALALLRSPVRLLWGIVLAGGGMYLLALHPLRQGALWAGSIALYLAASSLLEPLRQEIDTPGAAKVLLPWRFEKVLWLHSLLPAVIMTVAGLLTLAVGLAAGFLAPLAVAHLVILTIPLSLVVVSAAAMSGRRGGRVSTSLVNMAAMDTMGFGAIFIVLQLTFWAIVSLVATGVSVWVLGGKYDFEFHPAFAAVLLVLIGLAFALQSAVRSKMGPDFFERLAEAQKGSLGR